MKKLKVLQQVLKNVKRTITIEKSQKYCKISKVLQNFKSIAILITKFQSITMSIVKSQSIVILLEPPMVAQSLYSRGFLARCLLYYMQTYDTSTNIKMKYDAISYEYNVRYDHLCSCRTCYI